YHHNFILSSQIPRPPTSILFPYTTLFRSRQDCFMAVPGMHGLVERMALQDWAQGFYDEARTRYEYLAKLSDGQGENQSLEDRVRDRKSTRLNSSHVKISYAVFCLKKKTK